jgi:hypothetical protein
MRNLHAGAPDDYITASTQSRDQVIIFGQLRAGSCRAKRRIEPNTLQSAQFQRHVCAANTELRRKGTFRPLVIEAAKAYAEHRMHFHERRAQWHRKPRLNWSTEYCCKWITGRRFRNRT